LKEVKRILMKQGKAFIAVWNKWQLRFLFKSREALIPWRLKDKVLYRYYYLFSPLELKKKLIQLDFKILKHNWFGRNLIFEVKK